MFRIRKQKEEKYSYVLDTRESRLVRLLGALGLVSTTFGVLGYLQFLYMSTLLAVAFGPTLVVITAYYVIQFFLMSTYPGFDLARHKQKVIDYWQKTNTAPRVAVFIPAAGEDVDVVRGTVLAATKIQYPKYKVFVLDDSTDGLYRALAANYGASYIRRQDIGSFKKAGNMNYALEKIVGFDFVLVLDADFQPRPEILKELVPYTGENVGIVQSPQHFEMDAKAHARSKFEYGAAYIQRDFYRITQVARNKYGAAICVGTCALYNVQALKRVGGWEGVGMFRGWSHSEDVYTGLKMLNSYNSSDERYKVTYVPVQLAKGTCPDSHLSFYKQQNRWATGSMQLMFSSQTIRSDKLSTMQRVIYGSNSLYYYYTIMLLVSPLYLLAMALSSNPSSWAFTLYFIPPLVFKHVLEPYVMRRERAPLATSLVVLSNAYTFLQAVVLLIVKKPLGWEATGAKSKNKSAHFTHFKLSVTIGFIALYIVTLGVLIMNERFRYGPSVFILCIFLASFLAHIAFLFYTLVKSNESKRKIADRKFYTAILLAAAIGFVTYETSIYHNKYDVILRDNRINIEKQTSIKPYDTPLDGYRRSLGDVKHLLGLQ